MNQQNGYSAYPPPPPQQFAYGASPYPPQQQTQYAFPAQQQSTPQAPHTYQPSQNQAQQQPAPYFRSFSGADSLPAQQQYQQAPQQQLQQQHQSTAQPTPSQRRQGKQPARRKNAQQQPQNAETPAGPGAPGPDINNEDLEEQLREALGRENEPQEDGNQQQNEDDNDEDEDENHDEGDENEPIFNLPPPPEGNYPSGDDLEKSIHAWSLEHGYEMVRRASKKNAAGAIYKRYYHCSKHGKLANTGKLTEQTRVRVRRKSNRMGCPMSLAAVAVDPSNPAGEWQIRHRKTHHNHGPLDAVTMAGHRRRARMGGVEKAVDGLFAIGTPTAQVLTFLQRTNPDGLFTRTDVANMKLKFKKYGTCQHIPNQFSKDPDKTAGLPSACLSCRAKKTRCDSQRPVCGTCMNNGMRCEYDHQPGEVGPAHQRANAPSSAQATPARQQTQAVATAPTPTDSGDGAMTSTTANAATTSRTRNQRGPTELAKNREQANQILQDLQNFQNEYVKPKRLDINSSTVEILAQSSCGNGDSYKSVPPLTRTTDWQAFSEAFVEASLKENTNDVLIGEKTEPVRPIGHAPGESDLNTGARGGGNGEIDVEDWNEYIKQLAIFNRRNQALLGALWGSLSPSFRTRVQGFRYASQAWHALLEMCYPRGSDQAWRLYNEMCNITLESCGGSIMDYSSSLQTKYAEFCRLRLSTQYPHDKGERYNPRMLNTPNAGPSTPNGQHKNLIGTGGDVLSEEAVCFLFLRNLGPTYSRWVEQLCMTSNIAGFGTGFKLSLRDLIKRAEELDGMRQGGRISGAHG
ncbi:FAR1 DNA-binding domain [Teratosphaeria destructans]|uniref:FAR1 DNA-binding domain n=1 Tax=Teratosphaeria destructans TaxID=418781 RepID=A0A9W7SVK2_9PEZI|nr:FAR1 DNA-binding domain [Teratosphaeria destructans]